MEIYGNDVNGYLLRLVDSGARYHLAVKKAEVRLIEPKALNLGYSLSTSISRIEKIYDKSDAKFQLSIAETIRQIIKQSVFKDDVLGMVVILDNLGILFEPELHIDVIELFRWISKNTLTVLLWPGEIDETALYFLDMSSKYIIKQIDINYTII